jgi:hypothetical protein
MGCATALFQPGGKRVTTVSERTNTRRKRGGEPRTPISGKQLNDGNWPERKPEASGVPLLQKAGTP